MITIRKARQDESVILARIGVRSWENAMASIGAMPGMLEKARSAFENFVRSSWLTITVVEQDGVVAGWAAREDLDGKISDFWIDPAYERRGLGAALLQSLEAAMLHQGFKTATLESHARNDGAVAFFESRGYRVVWLSVTYSLKLDRDVQSVGLSKQLVRDDDEPCAAPFYPAL